MLVAVQVPLSPVSPLRYWSRTLTLVNCQAQQRRGSVNTKRCSMKAINYHWQTSNSVELTQACTVDKCSNATISMKTATAAISVLQLKEYRSMEHCCRPTTTMHARGGARRSEGTSHESFTYSSHGSSAALLIAVRGGRPPPIGSKARATLLLHSSRHVGQQPRGAERCRECGKRLGRNMPYHIHNMTFSDLTISCIFAVQSVVVQ